MPEIEGKKQVKHHLTPEMKAVQWKKGQSGHPEGRPKGKTIKELVREWLEHNPDDMRAFVKHFVKDNRDLAWQMLEGSPARNVEVSVQAKPIPLLQGIPENVPVLDDGSKTVQINEPSIPVDNIDKS